jgi:hypothetical protein
MILDSPTPAKEPDPRDAKITKRDIISQDKDGKLEKVYFQKEARIIKHDDGTQETKIVEPWEIRAEGRKLQELRGAFKETAPEMLHNGMKEWEKGGGTLVVTKPDGTTDTIRADKEQMYREMHGFCKTRVRPGIMMKQMPWHKPCGHSKYQACHCEEE